MSPKTTGRSGSGQPDWSPRRHTPKEFCDFAVECPPHSVSVLNLSAIR